MVYTVDMTWDEEAEVWVAINEEIPIILESPSFDELIERVKLAAPELLELNGLTADNSHLCFIVAHFERIA